MKVFNLEGSAIFGPGSEWLWSMLQFVIVAATLIGLYRQIRLQSSASAIEQLRSWDGEWKSERNTRYRLDVLTALRDGTDQAHIPAAAAGALGDFWEKIGALARQGHLDQKLLWSLSGSDCPGWWSILEPFARRLRGEHDDPLILEHFEWLAGRMASQDRKAGLPQREGGPVLAGWLEGIALCEHQLRVEQSLRTVLVAPPEGWAEPDSTPGASVPLD